MKKYVIFSVAGIFILACNAISNFSPSTSSLPEAPASPDAATSLPVDTSPSPVPADENSLVGRNPLEWFPEPEVFSALNDIPFKGYDAYVNEDFAGLFYNPATQTENWQKELDIYNQSGRIVNFTYQWSIPECNKKKESPSAYVMATLYKDAQGAQVGLESYSNRYDSPTNPKQEVEVGDVAYTAFYSTPSCGFGGWTTFVYFRRNNIFGTVGVSTFELTARSEKLEIAMALAHQFDRVILNEMASHPGTPADLTALKESAKSIDISSSPAQNPPIGSGDVTPFIFPSLTCGATGSGPDDTYNLYGTVENISKSPINLTVEWGADDSGFVGYADANATVVKQTIRIHQNYTSTIEREGGGITLDNTGYPYTVCKIYSITASWAEK